LKTNPLEVKRQKRRRSEVQAYVAERLKSGELQMSCEDPDAPENWPRNLFVWRSNLLGSSARGMNISSSTCSAPSMACRARIWARRQA
jgi:nitrate reductase alpha subunit